MKFEVPIEIRGFGMDIRKSFMTIDQDGLTFDLYGVFTNDVEAGEDFSLGFCMLPPHPAAETKRWKRWWGLFRWFSFWRSNG
jgi:hypothetical protein